MVRLQLGQLPAQAINLGVACVARAGGAALASGQISARSTRARCALLEGLGERLDLLVVLRVTRVALGDGGAATCVGVSNSAFEPFERSRRGWRRSRQLLLTDLELERGELESFSSVSYSARACSISTPRRVSSSSFAESSLRRMLMSFSFAETTSMTSFSPMNFCSSRSSTCAAVLALFLDERVLHVVEATHHVVVLELGFL